MNNKRIKLEIEFINFTHDLNYFLKKQKIETTDYKRLT